MRVRGGLLLVALALGCGRIDFDAIEVPMTSGVFTSISLPDGGTVGHIVVAPDGVTRYAVGFGGLPSRSTDGLTWTACGYIAAGGIAVTSDGVVYAAGRDDVYASRDRCATWQSTQLGQRPNAVGATPTVAFAMTNTRLESYQGGSWVAETTPLDGMKFQSFASDATGSELLAGTAGGGVVRRASTASAWALAATGLATKYVRTLAIAPSNAAIAYAVETDAGGGAGDIAYSRDGGTTWTIGLMPGGFGLAVDPSDPMHVIASIFDDLAMTTDGFTTATRGLRSAAGTAEMLDFAFEPSGALLAGTSSGVFASTATQPATLAWQAQSKGLQAWWTRAIRTTSTDVYVGTDSGVLHGIGGAYVLELSGFQIDTYVPDILVLADGSVLASGHQLRLSMDRGASWPEVYDAQVADGYTAQPLATDGSRVFAGTGTRLIYADAPYTTWTATAFPNGAHRVNGLALVSGVLWIATDGGVFSSADAGSTIQIVSGFPAIGTVSVAVLSDGTVVVGSFTGAWFRDAGTTTWQQRGLATNVVSSLATSATTVYAATDGGVFVSSDRGATWTDIPGLDDHVPTAVAIDARTGNLLIGTFGSGLWTTTP
jgi:hypothetical protein